MLLSDRKSAWDLAMAEKKHGNKIDENIGRGMSLDQAQRQAYLKFGNLQRCETFSGSRTRRLS